MIIEFEHCDIKIRYIGTIYEIEIDVLRDCIDDFIIAVRGLVDTINRVFGNVKLY